MKRILFLLLVSAFLVSGCASEADKEWEHNLYEYAFTMGDVIELMTLNQTEAALILCDGTSSDFAKNACYVFYIQVQNATNRSIPAYICDGLKPDAELPPKKALERFEGEKKDYEAYKEYTIQLITSHKEACYELTKES